MTQCALRDIKKLNAAKGFPRRMTRFTETRKQKNVTWMEIVAWIVKKQSYVCLFAYWPRKSCTQQLHASRDAEQCGGKEKSTRCAGHTVDTRPFFRVESTCGTERLACTQLTHLLPHFWASVRELDVAFPFRWREGSRLWRTCAMYNLKGGSNLHGGYVEECAWCSFLNKRRAINTGEVICLSGLQESMCRVS